MVKNVQAQPVHTFYARQGTMVACYYKQNENHKSTLLLSTSAKGGEGKSGKPKMVEVCNKNKGGVDLSYQMLYSYMDESKAVNYWKQLYLMCSNSCC